MANSTHILADLIDWVDYLFYGILTRDRSSGLPYCADTDEGFMISDTPRSGFTQLDESDTVRVRAYKQWNECDHAAHVLLPLLAKILGDEATSLNIVHRWLVPLLVIKHADDTRQAVNGMAFHALIVVNRKDGPPLAVDPTREQFGFVSHEMLYTDYLAAHSNSHTQQFPPTIRTWGEHARWMEHNLEKFPEERREAIRERVSQYRALSANVEQAYDEWAAMTVQEGETALQILGGGPSEAKDKLTMAIWNVADRCQG